MEIWGDLGDLVEWIGELGDLVEIDGGLVGIVCVGDSD